MRIDTIRTAGAAALAAIAMAGCSRQAPEAFREPGKAVRQVETNVQALQVWAAAKARADLLVHIDAVDDMAAFPAAVSEAMLAAADQLARGNAGIIGPAAATLEGGGTVNLGYHAGLYRRVVWVVPAVRPVTEAPVENFRSVLAAKRGYAAADLADLRASGKTITGTIDGVPLTVTALEDLEIGEERAIVDIDLGWFVGLQGQDPSYRPGTAALLNVVRALARKRIPAVCVTITRNSPRQSIPLDIRYYAQVIEDLLADPGLVAGPTPPLYESMIRAEEALRGGRFEEAQALYAGLTSRRGDMAGLFFSLGLVEGFLDRPERSRGALLRAYELDQAYLPGFFQLARVLAGMDLVRAGEYLLDTPDLINVIPGVEMDYQRGFFYLGAGRPYDAITFLVRVAAQRREDFALRTVLRQAYEEVGDAASERRIIGELFSLDTARVERDMPWIYRRLGELAEEAGDLPAAAEAYERYLELVPGDEGADQMRKVIGQARRPRRAE